MRFEMMWYLWVVVLISPTVGRTRDDWVSHRRSIYHLLTDRFALDPADERSRCTSDKNSTSRRCPWGGYCGGTWGGMEIKIPYIEDLGFNAVWISPIQENPQCGYHGYHISDWSRLNSEFGGEVEFESLMKKLESSNIWVMVDVVFNHMAPVDDLSTLYPFNKEDAHYHPPCYMDFDDPTAVTDCWLWGLPDLKQENPYVTDTLLEWIDKWTNKYSIDAVRIDAVKHVPDFFWEKFVNQTDIYALAEDMTHDPKILATWKTKKLFNGMLNYPLCFALRNVFIHKSGMSRLQKTMRELINANLDIDALGNFVDSHDLPRFLLKQDDKVLYLNALTFMFGSRGIPILFYGSEQGDQGDWTALEDTYFDDQNRRPLWLHNYDTSSVLYQTIRAMNHLRQEGHFDGFQRELLVRQNVYVYARTDDDGSGGTATERKRDEDGRGDGRGGIRVALVVTTQVGRGGGAQSVPIRARILTDGTLYCDVLSPIFHGRPRCFRVYDNLLNVELLGGYPAVLVQRPLAGCFEHAAYHGKPFQTIHTVAAEACQAQCQKKKKCRGFTFYHQKKDNCVLFESVTDTVLWSSDTSSLSVTSGPRRCWFHRECYSKGLRNTSRSFLRMAAATAEECQIRCFDDSGCNYFSFNGKDCYLHEGLRTRRGFTRRPASNRNAIVSGPKICSGSFEQAIYHHPNVEELYALPSVEACQSACARNHACTHYSYITPSSEGDDVSLCHMKDLSQAAARPLSHGSPLKSEDVHSGRLVLSGPVRHCFEMVQYKGRVVFTSATARSFVDCQILCQRSAYCKVFSYHPRQPLCILFESVSSRSLSRQGSMVVSGPKRCP